MAKYVLHGTYAFDGVQGLAANGASPRRENATSHIESVGGSVDCFYYAFGDDGQIEVLAICDLPDRAAAAALALVINSSGRVTGGVRPLYTVEEMDKGAVANASFVPHQG